MVFNLPPKVFKTLAPAIKGNLGGAREAKFGPLMQVFTGYLGCTVVKRQGNRFKVSPPQSGQGIWHWKRVPFFMHKPVDGILRGKRLYGVQNTLKDQYGWDKNTFTCEDGRA